MSLHPQAIPTIPQGTIRVAHAAFPNGNIYLQLKDELGSIYEDESFVHLFPQRGQPATSPWQLALITDLSDTLYHLLLCSIWKTYLTGKLPMQVDVLRHSFSRIDWKYAIEQLLNVGSELRIN